MRILKRAANAIYFLAELFLFFLIVLVMYLGYAIQLRYPDITDQSSLKLERVTEGENQYRIGNNWSRKNDHGVWEVYIEGEPFERGVIYGKLLEEEVQLQEDHFIGQIEKIVPSPFYRFFIKVLIGYFNRDLYDYVPEEFRNEIYGVSFAFSDEYDNEGPKFHRILNYHAAHDIGHALTDYMLVGCSSFSVKNGFSVDLTLIVGRNFDFYVGEEFAEEKLLAFVSPTEGYKFASYSWAGLMGVVSGMNETGLCVTINASKSDLPTKTKTPISIVTREILQYAATIDEAIAIARKREVFVSETIMITSAVDNRTVLVEISPNAIDVYDPGDDKIICTNHYQSDTYKNEKSNLTNIATSDSKYRYDRLNELIAEKDSLSVLDVAKILRNRAGKNNEELGMGNPMAINQLIAHHSVIFKPSEKQMWISTPPYQLGDFLCYDLDEVFQEPGKQNLRNELYVDSLSIPEDQFVKSKAYQDYVLFLKTKKRLSESFMLGIDYDLSEKEENLFIQRNPESYITYMVLGEYFLNLDKKEKANHYFSMALSKKVASKKEEEKIKELLDECND